AAVADVSSQAWPLTSANCIYLRCLRSQRLVDLAATIDRDIAEQPALSHLIVIPIIVINDRIEADAFNRNACTPRCAHFLCHGGIPVRPLLPLSTCFAQQDWSAIAGV